MAPQLSAVDHKLRHLGLLNAFNELMADYTVSTGTCPPLDKISANDLFSWATKQFQSPGKITHAHEPATRADLHQWEDLYSNPGKAGFEG